MVNERMNEKRIVNEYDLKDFIVCTDNSLKVFRCSILCSELQRFYSLQDAFNFFYKTR